MQTAALQDDKKLCPDAQGVLQPCTNTQFEQGVTRAREFAAQRSDFVRRAVTTAGLQLSSTGPRLNLVGGPLTPGSLYALYGERLADAEMQAASVPLPTSLGGVAVFINGFAVPLLYVSPGQINLQIPWEVAGEGLPVTVVSNGVVGNTVSLDAGQSQPVLYSITNAAGTPVTGARAGDVLILLATGLGPVNGNPVTGRAGPADPLLRTRELPTVRVGGVSTEVLFSGLAPGLVGVYQLNARLSAGVPAGSQTPVLVGVGSQVSAPLTIPTL